LTASRAERVEVNALHLSSFLLYWVWRGRLQCRCAPQCVRFYVGRPH